MVRPSHRSTVSLGAWSGAQARAYAAAGLAQDGHPEALASLDAAATACIQDMRQRLGVGASARAGGAADQLGAGVAHAGGAGLTVAGTAPPGASIGHLDLGQADRGIQSGRDGVVLTGTQVWALVRMRSDQGQIAITDQSGGAYVVSLSGSDFSTIRLDGGLVVPGRSYPVSGSVRITGSAACAITIRPAAVVPAIASGPLLATSGEQAG